MKSSKIIIYLTLILFFTSCKKCKDCNGTEFQGDIVTGYNLPVCYENGLPKTEYYIRDTIQFINMLKMYPNYKTNCDTNFTNINIDFSKYILIGKYLSNGGCRGKYIKNVIIDTNNKIVTYTIFSCSKGTCKKLISSYNFVIVQKFSNKYILKFNAKKY